MKEFRSIDEVLDFADRVNSMGMRKVFEELAQEEVRHKLRFQTEYE